MRKTAGKLLWAIALAMFLARRSPSQEGSSSLTGSVQISTGDGLSYANVLLRPDGLPSKVYETEADSEGAFHFAGLLAGQYTLQLSSRYFATLTVKSIVIAANEQKRIPVLELVPGGMCWDETLPRAEFYRLLPSEDRVGDLAGRVYVEPGATLSESRLFAGAEVSLLNMEGAVCGKTKTDASGAFAFRGLSPENFSLRFERVGFYPESVSGYEVRAGFEKNWRFWIERCPNGNCDPRLRPRKPLVSCE